MDKKPSGIYGSLFTPVLGLVSSFILSPSRQFMWRFLVSCKAFILSPILANIFPISLHNSLLSWLNSHEGQAWFNCGWLPADLGLSRSIPVTYIPSKRSRRNKMILKRLAYLIVNNLLLEVSPSKLTCSWRKNGRRKDFFAGNCFKYS